MNWPLMSDDEKLRPGWNQSPPHLPVELTTRQDLNNLVYSRKLYHLGDPIGQLRCLRCCNIDHEFFHKQAEYELDARKRGLGYQSGLHSLSTIPTEPKEHRTGLLGLTSWLLSVLLTSTAITYLYTCDLRSFRLPTTSSNPLLPRASCAMGKASPGYDLAFHVGGLFVILLVSSTGCAFPILVTKFPRLRIPPGFLFGAKHFGTGVLIATAFVHLLPTAFLSLSNSCLSDFWTADYQAMPGAIMLASIFFVTIIEMVFSPNQHTCGGNKGMSSVVREPKAFTGGGEHPHPSNRLENTYRAYSDDNMAIRELGTLRGRDTSISRVLTRYRSRKSNPDAIEVVDPGCAVDGRDCRLTEQEHADIADDLVPADDLQNSHLPSRHHPGSSPEQLHQKAIMQCFLLEVGILFHSIFIGMSLSVAVGNDFIVLLIAIVFHQTFEGLALGVRIADIKWKEGALQPWLMAMAYGCTTPLGQAIGIATHTLYSPDSEVGLLVVGIMNAVSAGFLIYASLVELMSEDFLSDESRRVLRGRKRIVACILVFAGAFLMSLVGAWA